MPQPPPNKPPYRYTLKGEIIKAGFRTVSEFAEEIGATNGRLSRTIRGWEYPSPGLQRRMAKGLGVSVKELRELL